MVAVLLSTATVCVGAEVLPAATWKVSPVCEVTRPSVTGVYSSANDRLGEPLVDPPATKTLPSRSAVAEAVKRAVPMLPVVEKAPVAGLYSSAEFV